MAQCLIPRYPHGLRPAGQPGQRLLTDTAPGNIDYAEKTDAIIKVLDKPEVGNNILNLTPLVEAGTGDQLIGCAEANKGFFKDPGLGISAVHYGAVPQLGLPLAHQALYLVDDKLGFFLFGIGLNHRGQFACLVVRPQALGLTLLVG